MSAQWIRAVVTAVAIVAACGCAGPTAAPTVLPAPPSLIGAASPPTLVPTPRPSPTTSAPVATPTPAPTEPPRPTSTPVTVHVGNDSGTTVFLYNSPTIGDRIQPYPDGTPMQIVGEDVEGDGLMWHQVRAPDGTQGYLQTVDTLPD